MILMDEPTSNLDSLNEGIILKSLEESAKKKIRCAGIPQSIYHECGRCGLRNGKRAAVMNLKFKLKIGQALVVCNPHF